MLSAAKSQYRSGLRVLCQNGSLSAYLWATFAIAIGAGDEA